MNELNFSKLFLGIIITAIIYMIYPFVRTQFMNVEYDEKSCKKMAMWNSIIIGLIDLIFAVSNDETIMWSAGPAFIYYLINKSLWITKKHTISIFTCSNCGEDVAEDEMECPNCGATFETNEKEEEKIAYECSNCGEGVTENATECPSCRATFEVKENKKNNIFTCPKCSANVENDIAECHNCGTIFRGELLEKKIEEKINNEYINLLLDSSNKLFEKKEIEKFVKILNKAKTNSKKECLNEFEKFANDIIKKDPLSAIMKISYLYGVLNSNEVIDEEEMNLRNEKQQKKILDILIKKSQSK